MSHLGPHRRRTLVLAGLLALGLAPVSSRAADSEVQAALRPLAEVLTGVRSIYLHANGFLDAAGASATAPRSGGTVEYTAWDADRKYRIAVSTSGNAPIAADAEVSFDGRQYQVFLVHDGLLSVRKDDSPALPISVPNPFLLFFDYAQVVDDGCGGCMPRVADLAAKGRHLLTPGIARVESGGTPDKLALRLRDGTLRGVNDDFRLAFEKAGAGWRLRETRRMTRDGRTMVAIRYDDFVKVGAKEEFELPRHLSVEIYDRTADGTPSMRIEYFLDILEINGAIPDERFSLDRDRARSIWDADAKAFVKGGR